MNELNKKLQLKPGTKWLLFNAPTNYLPLIEPLPEDVNIGYEPVSVFNGIQLFIKNSTELADSLEVIKPVLKDDTIFWVIYPKKSSGIKTDLEMMGTWDALSAIGLRIVTSVSVNETWTALRFKPVEKTKLSDSRNENIPANQYGDFIDVANKQVILPPDAAATLEQNHAAMSFYQSLSYSNKKEYVVWILSAKQEKTQMNG